MECIWLWNIHNCNQDKILFKIVITGIVYISFIIILLIYTLIIFYKRKKHFDLLAKFNLGLLISFSIRFLYLIMLFINISSILFLLMIQEIFWTLFIGTYNILLHDMSKLLLYNDNHIDMFYKKKITTIKDNTIYTSYIFYPLTFMFSFISGLFFEYNNNKGYIYLGIQFILWGLHILYIGSFFILFLYKYNQQLKTLLKNNNIINNKTKFAIKKIKIITIIVIPNVIIFPVLWIYQGINMYIMQNMYDWNIIFISFLWYWLAISIGSTISCVLLFIHTREKK